MTLTLGKKNCREGLNVCMNFQFNLLQTMSETAVVAAVAAAHEGDDNTPSGSTHRRAGARG